MGVGPRRPWAPGALALAGREGPIFPRPLDFIPILQMGRLRPLATCCFGRRMGTEVSHFSLHFRTRQGQDLGLTQQAPRSRRGGRGCSPPSRDAAAVVRAVRAGPGGAGGRGAVGVGGAAAALLPGARAHAALRHGGPALHPVGARAPAPAEPRCGRGSAARMRQSQGGRKTLPGGCAGWVTQGRPHRHPAPGSCGSPRG